MTSGKMEISYQMPIRTFTESAAKNEAWAWVGQDNDSLLPKAYVSLQGFVFSYKTKY